MRVHAPAVRIRGRPSPASVADRRARCPLARSLAWPALASAAATALAAGAGAQLRDGPTVPGALSLIAAAAMVPLALWAFANRVRASLDSASSETDALRVQLAAGERSQDRLRHLAYHDTLTGLPNRSLLQDRLGVAVRQARRRASRIGVLCVDLDDFKAVNDSYGHATGDCLLVELAARIRSGIRAGDTVARVGGDEFVVLLDSVTGADDAARVAAKVLASVRATFHCDGHDLLVKASVGVSTYPADGTSVDQLLRSADAAMYDAKRRAAGAPG